MVTSFEELVAALQPVPYEATVHRFLFTGSTAEGQRRVSITLDGLSLIPLVEAIGIGLEHARGRMDQSGDAALDALQLLKVLEKIFEGLNANVSSIDTAHFELVLQARAELAQQQMGG